MAWKCSEGAFQDQCLSDPLECHLSPLAGSSVRQCREVGVLLCDSALDARAADGGPVENLGSMQGPMIQDQSVTGRELGRDAGGGRKISGDPLVWKLSVVRRRKRKIAHAPMRPA